MPPKSSPNGNHCHLIFPAIWKSRHLQSKKGTYLSFNRGRCGAECMLGPQRMRCPPSPIHEDHPYSFLPWTVSVVRLYFLPHWHQTWFNQWNMGRRDLYHFPEEAIEEVLSFHLYSFCSESVLYPVGVPGSQNDDTWNRLWSSDDRSHGQELYLCSCKSLSVQSYNPKIT